ISGSLVRFHIFPIQVGCKNEDSLWRRVIQHREPRSLRNDSESKSKDDVNGSRIVFVSCGPALI
ncbi:hypothetical protein, partial [Ralstonia solanacearum]|uniref:hypothetical protein n=1 Tax=Ralstonia solanacearum TaxID=305 RepID=UPI001A8D6A76